MKAINFVAQCQSKTLSQQYKEGIRFFDIRIRFDKTGAIKYVHGIIEYNHDVDLLKYLNQKGDCSLRLMLDDRNGCNSEEQTQMLLTYLNEHQEDLNNINLIDIYRLSDSKCIVNYNNPMPTVDAQYASASTCKIVGIYPKLWHKLHKYTEPNCEYLIRDFV